MKTHNKLIAAAAVALAFVATSCAGWDADVGVSTGPYYYGGGSGWTNYPYYTPFYSGIVPSTPPVVGNGPGSAINPNPNPQPQPNPQPNAPQSPTPQPQPNPNPQPNINPIPGMGNGQRPGANMVGSLQPSGITPNTPSSMQPIQLGGNGAPGGN